jgi:hypothetical protein
MSTAIAATIARTESSRSGADQIAVATPAVRTPLSARWIVGADGRLSATWQRRDDPMLDVHR